MLTMERHRDPKLARLYHGYLAAGPAEYMAASFRKLTPSADALQRHGMDWIRLSGMSSMAAAFPGCGEEYKNARPIRACDTQLRNGDPLTEQVPIL